MNSNNEEFSKGSIRTSKKRINKRNEVGSERFQNKKWPNANCVTEALNCYCSLLTRKEVFSLNEKRIKRFL